MSTSEPSPYDAKVLMCGAFAPGVAAMLLEAAGHMRVSVRVGHTDVGDAPYLWGVTLLAGDRQAHLDPVANDISALMLGGRGHDTAVPDASHRVITTESVAATIAWVKVALL